MKRIALSLISSSLLASSAFAWVGGPFDNNMFFGRETNGTYQGVISGKNLSGVMIFGTTDSSSSGKGSYDTNIGVFGNTGRAIIFVPKEDTTSNQGSTGMVVAQVSAVSNFPSRKLAGTIDGSQLIDQQSVVIPKIVSWSYTTPEWTDGDGTVHPPIPGHITYEDLSFTYDNVVQISGSFDAKFVRTFPSLEFSGSGKLQVTQSDGWDSMGGNDIDTPLSVWVKTKTTDVDVRVSGVRTSTSNPYILGELPTYRPSIVPASNN